MGHWRKERKEWRDWKWDEIERIRGKFIEMEDNERRLNICIIGFSEEGKSYIQWNRTNIYNCNSRKYFRNNTWIYILERSTMYQENLSVTMSRHILIKLWDFIGNKIFPVPLNKKI